MTFTFYFNDVKKGLLNVTIVSLKQLNCDRLSVPIGDLFNYNCKC